ncbi:hypothetical protein BH10ACT1_BH10ACT1_03920 [soil metagenome]
MEAEELLQVRCLRVGHTETITVIGDLDVFTAPLLAAEVSKALDADVGKIIIDAADLAYIDSTGIGALVKAWASMKGRATMPVVVTNLRPNVQRVLDICGVTDILTE